ncbi:MAG: class I SAM-dependent methyltransferase [Moorellales bacterium]
MGFEREYYDQARLWEADFSALPAERERISATIALIPPDVKTILDVGCGNGAFLHALPPTYEAIGVDSSREALKHVKAKAIHGDAAALPFPAGSFDLVTCLEVLEHLPVRAFERALRELQRVSRKYIIISVPNTENLDHHLVICPECHCWYNPNRHVRSFTPESLRTLLVEFTLATLKEIGPIESRPRYNRVVYGAYKLWKGTLPPATAMCPQCGHQVDAGGRCLQSVSEIRRHLRLTSLVKPMARALWRPRRVPRWLLGLYVKRGSENGELC